MKKMLLGRTYKDRLHGIQGIATHEIRYITGCNRVCLEKLDKDGCIQEFYFDVNMVDLMPQVVATNVEVTPKGVPCTSVQPNGRLTRATNNLCAH